MPLDFSRFHQGLLSVSPYTNVVVKELVPGRAIGFEFFSPRLKSPVYANLDGWPNPEIGKRAFIRIGTQADGCTFGCKSCAAPLLGRGRNLREDEIVYQAQYVLMSKFVNLSRTEQLVISTTGLGDPFGNVLTIPSTVRLRNMLPGAKFMLSTSGPKTGLKVFRPAVELVRGGMDMDLQISVHSPRQKWRLDFVGDRLYKGRPLMSWTLLDLSKRAEEWFLETGRKAHVNIAIGPDFHSWGVSDYDELWRLFPPAIVVIKVSLEGPRDGSVWDSTPYRLAVGERLSHFQQMGYDDAYQYMPEGVDIGASCGAAPADGKLITIG